MQLIAWLTTVYSLPGSAGAMSVSVWASYHRRRLLWLDEIPVVSHSVNELQITAGIQAVLWQLTSAEIWLNKPKLLVY